MSKETTTSPYKQFNEAAKAHAKNRRTQGAVHVRLSMLVLGIAIALAFYFYPDLLHPSTSSSSKYRKEREKCWFSELMPSS